MPSLATLFGIDLHAHTMREFNEALFMGDMCVWHDMLDNRRWVKMVQGVNGAGDTMYGVETWWTDSKGWQSSYRCTMYENAREAVDAYAAEREGF